MISMIRLDLFTRRVATRVLSASIFAALALLGFAATFQFAEEAGDFARLRDAAWSTALRLPQIAIFVLPLAALIGSAAAFRLLAARREMLAARACGYSPRAAAAAAAAAAAVLAAAHFLAGEYALAPAENALRVLGAPAGREARVFGRALWLRDGGDYARAGRVEFGAEFLEDISIYRISPTARLTAVIEAPRAHWREGEGAADSFWDLQDARVIEVSESSRRDFRFSNFEWRGGLTPEVFAAFLVKPRAMATSHLRAAISRLGDNRQSAAPFIEEFWRRIVLSVSLPLLAACGALFGLRAKGGLPGALALSVAGAGVYYFALRLFGNLAAALSLPAFVGSWAAFAGLAAAAAWSMRRLGRIE